MPPPSTALVPSPQWGTFWNTTKTLRGFKNTNGSTCYRNAILQMLFHLPVFLNWVHLWVAVHVDTEGHCPFGNSPDTTEVEDTPCKVCLLHDLLGAFWDPKMDNEDFESALDDFWEVTFDDWLQSKPQDGTSHYGQQDVLGFISEILQQLSENLSNSFFEGLNDIFGIEALDKKTCTGGSGCGDQSLNPDVFDFLTVQFTEDQDSQTLEGALENTFVKEQTDVVCTACKANSLEAELVLTKVPEVLVVHLNRIGEHDTDSGEIKKFKIQSEIAFPEGLVIQKKWLDPRLGGIRNDIKYVLSSVLLHESETTDGGHYMAAVESQDGTWTLANDMALSTYGSFEAMAASKTIRKNACLFAYRRLPLVTRGPAISLKESLRHAKYSDPGATENNDKMDIDEEPAEVNGNMDIGLNESLLDAEMKDVSLPKPEPKVARQYDETEMELEEKQRGTLEVKFTTNTGVTTLKVHVKGMLWNELKDKSRRPVTRSLVAGSTQASDVVLPKPIKITPKAIREKSSSKKPVKEKKRQPEKQPRPPKSGRVVKSTSPKNSVKK